MINPLVTPTHLDCEPHGVEDVALLGETEQFVRDGDCVHVGLLSVVEIRVWLPDPRQHGDAQGETFDGTLKAQSLIPPVLPEVAVHGVIHVQFRNWTHAADEDVSLDDRWYALAMCWELGIGVALKEILQDHRYVLAHVHRCSFLRQCLDKWILVDIWMMNGISRDAMTKRKIFVRTISCCLKKAV